jgi:hypothetical protein
MARNGGRNHAISVLSRHIHGAILYGVGEAFAYYREQSDVSVNVEVYVDCNGHCDRDTVLNCRFEAILLNCYDRAFIQTVA